MLNDDGFQCLSILVESGSWQQNNIRGSCVSVDCWIWPIKCASPVIGWFKWSPCDSCAASQLGPDAKTFYYQHNQWFSFDFVKKVMETWNQLPAEVVGQSSVTEFKTCLGQIHVHLPTKIQNKNNKNNNETMMIMSQRTDLVNHSLFFWHQFSIFLWTTARLLSTSWTGNRYNRHIMPLTSPVAFRSFQHPPVFSIIFHIF